MLLLQMVVEGSLLHLLIAVVALDAATLPFVVADEAFLTPGISPVGNARPDLPWNEHHALCLDDVQEEPDAFKKFDQDVLRFLTERGFLQGKEPIIYI